LARRSLVFAALLVALVLATIASLALGAVRIPAAEVIDVLLGKGDGGPDQQIVESLRLPRTVEALVIGAALGIAGAILQGALANPLASPDVIGVTGGAGFGAILIIILFPGSIALLPVGACSSACWRRRWSSSLPGRVATAAAPAR
jgi:iron complex transport system permease protein